MGSDHKPLETIYNKPLVSAPKRVQRMFLRLQKYDLDICFKPRRHMYLADTLSRAYLKNTSNVSELAAEVLVIEKELEQIHMADFLPISQPRKKKNTKRDGK